MQDQPSSHDATDAASSQEDELETVIKLLSELGPDRVAALLLQEANSSPSMQRELMSTSGRKVQIWLAKGDLDRAAQALALVKVIAEALGAPWAMAVYYFWQGRLEQDKGKLEATIGYYERALEGLDDRTLHVGALYNLALALLDTGKLDKAEHQFQEALKAAQEYHDTLWIARSYLSLAQVAHIKHNRSEALKWLEQARQVGETIQGVLAEYHFWQGRLKQDEGQQEAAILHFKKATEGIEDPKKHVAAMYSIASLLIDAGDLVRAQYQLQETIKLAQKYKDSLGIASAYYALARLARVKNDRSEALSYLERARRIAETIDNPDLLAHIINDQGLLYAESGNLDFARKYYQQLEEYLTRQKARMSDNLRLRTQSALMANRATLAGRELGVREVSLEEIKQLTLQALTNQSSLSKLEQIDNLVGPGINQLWPDEEIEKMLQVIPRLLTAFRLANEIKYSEGILLAGGRLSGFYIMRGYFEPAYRVCSAAIDALEHVRSHAGDEENRLRYIQDKIDIYGQMVLLCLTLTETRQMPRYRRHAFSYIERAKSRTLIEALGRATNVTPPSRLPTGLLQRETLILTQLRVLEMSLRTSMEVVKQEQVQSTYNEAQIELDEIWKQISDIAPEYAAQRRGQPVAFETVSELLRV